MTQLNPSKSTDAPLLIVLSGPSGVGKDAVLSKMRTLRRPYHFTVTATTRAQRPGEQDGVDYIFLEKAVFQQMIERDEFLEWAEVYGNLYGVPRAQVTNALDHGSDVIIKADVQGAATIRTMAPRALFIFLAPPDLAELERRLRARMTESCSALKLRLETAKLEMNESIKFDHIVINQNEQVDQAVLDIDRIVSIERSSERSRNIFL